MNRVRQQSSVVVAVLATPLIAVEGLGGARIGFASFEGGYAVAWFLTGIVLLGAGLLTTVKSSGTRTGLLLILAAAAWYLGGFRLASIDPLALIAERSQLLYGALLVHAIASFPSGRIADRVVVACVVAAWGVSLVPPPTGEVLIASSALLVLVLSHRPGGTPVIGPRWVIPVASLALAAGLASVAVGPALLPADLATDPRWILDISVSLVAVAVAGGVAIAGSRSARLTDIVVELGTVGGGGLEAALAAAIGDPTVRVAYRAGNQDRYVDAAGQAVLVPATGGAFAVTPIGGSAVAAAVIIHDPAVNADAAIREAFGRAAELSAANARLQAEVNARIEEVDSSRRRLLVARDDERRALGQLIREGVEPRLLALEDAVRELDLRADVDPQSEPLPDRLVGIRANLAALAEGLHPRVLDERGLPGALEELARRCPIPVILDVPVDITGSSTAEATLYFVCSEAMVNAARHAQARSIRVTVVRHGTDLVVEIIDDGVGNADAAHGTGLTGLRERIEASGGTLAIQSPSGEGTRLVAVISSPMAGSRPAGPSNTSLSVHP